MIKNFTPHQVRIVDAEGNVLATFPSLGTLRVKSNQKLVGHATYNDQEEMQGIPVFATEFGGIDNLPPKQKDTVYIVSRIVKNACSDRHDFVVPNELVRNQDGQIIGCQSFSR